MLYKLTDAEIRNLCKEKLESLEHWLRRLIDETLSSKYGDYFSYVDSAGRRLIKNDIVQKAEERRRKEPDRYKRKIDALLLNDVVTIICNSKIYLNFKPALEGAFPEGANEARTFLKRLTDPRNNLAHANPISLRQAEQVVCYSNDVIDSLKAYYAVIGIQQEYNVPLIFKFTDSFGNTFYRGQMRNFGPKVRIDLDNDRRFFLRPGDLLTVEVEVDPAFDPSEYNIHWWTPSKAIPSDPRNSSKIILNLLPSHVGLFLSINCTIRSNKDWHRMGDQGDDVLSITYKVLPPP